MSNETDKPAEESLPAGSRNGQTSLKKYMEEEARKISKAMMKGIDRSIEDDEESSKDSQKETSNEERKQRREFLVNNMIKSINSNIEKDEEFDRKHKINDYTPIRFEKRLPPLSTLVLRAAQFAAFKHASQRRKDTESSPYINHPITVALMIAEIGGIDDPEILAAALLHDTLEDTQTTPAELDQEFGSTVRKLVEEVTDDKSLPKAERKLLQIQHAATLSQGAVLIKLGDKIANVSDIIYSPPSNWDKIRKLEYFDWAEAVINNCQKVNPELEGYFSKVVTKGRNILRM